MKNYTYILFDWDGCLAKTLDVWLEAYKQVFSEYGVHPDTKTITHEIFGDWNGPKKLGIEDVEGFSEKMLTLVGKKYPTVDLYEGVKDSLLVLKEKNKKLALITTSTISIVKPALEHHNLTSLFETILAAEDVSKHKPDPEIIETAIARLDGVKEKSIIVGDSKSDLGAANNAGIDSLLFYPKHNTIFYDLDVLKTYKPTYIIENFKEILDIII